MNLLVLLTVLVPIATACSSGPEPSDSTGKHFTVDDAALAAWKRVLGPALSDLNEIRDLPGLEAAGPAKIGLCGFDNSTGKLRDLSAGRSWVSTAKEPDVPPADMKPDLRAAAGFMRIIDQLSNEGWTVVKRDIATRSTTSANPDYDIVFFKKKLVQTAVFLTVQVAYTHVLAELTFRGAPRACRRK